MPKWIDDRARHIREKSDLTSRYGKEKGERISWALATQQAHSLGKSPKSWGTSEGRREAKEKYDTPKDDTRTARPKKSAAASLYAYGDPPGQAPLLESDPQTHSKHAALTNIFGTHGVPGASKKPQPPKLTPGITQVENAPGLRATFDKGVQLPGQAQLDTALKEMQGAKPQGFLNTIGSGLMSDKTKSQMFSEAAHAPNKALLEHMRSTMAPYFSDAQISTALKGAKDPTQAVRALHDLSRTVDHPGLHKALNPAELQKVWHGAGTNAMQNIQKSLRSRALMGGAAVAGGLYALDKVFRRPQPPPPRPVAYPSPYGYGR